MAMNGEVNHIRRSVFTNFNPDDAIEDITQIESLCVNCGQNVSLFIACGLTCKCFLLLLNHTFTELQKLIMLLRLSRFINIRL